MNILIITNWLTPSAGGLYYSVPGPLRYLQAMGHRILVLAAEDPVGEPGWESQWQGVDVATAKSWGPRRLGFAPGLLQKLGGFRPDIVHYHGFWMYSLHLAHLLSKAFVVPLIISPRGMLDPWILRHGRLQKTLARQLYVNRAVGRAAVMHALNSDEAGHIQMAYPGKRIEIVPNGTEVIVGSPRSVRKTFWDSLRGKRVLLFLGRLHSKKGILELVEAHLSAAGACDKYAKNVVLVVAGFGDADMERNLRRLIEGKPGIFYIGGVWGDEKREAIRNSHWFLLPSYGEGLPMAVLEAWAEGIPVAMTRQCNLPEGFSSGAAVEIVNSVHGLADGLRQLFTMDRVRYADMCREARNLVEAKFTWKAIAGDIEALYLRAGARID